MYSESFENPAARTEQGLRIPIDSKLPFASGLCMILSLVFQLGFLIVYNAMHIRQATDGLFSLMFNFLICATFIVFVFAAAKKSAKLLIVPISISALMYILNLLFFWHYSSIHFLVQNGILPQIMIMFEQIFPLITAFTVLILYCLTVTGKIKSNKPVIIVQIIPVLWSIYKLLSFLPNGISSNGILFTLESTAISVAASVSYILLFLGLSNNPNKKYYERRGFYQNADTINGVAPEVASYRAGDYKGQTYSKLGGWLLFTVVSNIIGAVFSIIQLALYSFLFYFLTQYFSQHAIFIGFMTVSGLCFIFVIVIRIIFAAMIIRKSRNFLKFYDICLLIDLFAGLSVMLLFIIMSNDLTYLSLIGAIISSLAGYFIWRAYFCKSLRVYIYMGNDGYLRNSLFAKNAEKPQIPGYTAINQYPAQTPPDFQKNNLDLIKELHALKEQGIISEKEFEQKKQELLNKI